MCMLKCELLCRKFASEYKGSGRPLHILVANAGAHITSMRTLPNGVPLQCQVIIRISATVQKILRPLDIPDEDAQRSQGHQ